ncbi:acyltransferase [Bacteroidota bacterium]
MNLTSILIKGIGAIRKYYNRFSGKIITKIILKGNGVRCPNNLKSYGVPIVICSKNAEFVIGHNFRMNNGYSSNIIGRQQRCIYNIKGRLIIGNNVGVSSIAIVCHDSITIEDGVRIGGNVIIYDTDFHSLNPMERVSVPEIKDHVSTKPVLLKENAFIGAHSIILKGVTIGKNAVVGAGSVVTKDVPDNQIWAGNPAKLIRLTDISGT